MGDTQRMAAAKISAANMGLKLGHAKQDTSRGWKMGRPPRSRTAPRPPPWTVRRLRPRLRTPERRLRSLKARRRLRSPPRAAPKSRIVCMFTPPGGRRVPRPARVGAERDVAAAGSKEDSGPRAPALGPCEAPGDAPRTPTSRSPGRSFAAAPSTETRAVRPAPPPSTNQSTPGLVPPWTPPPPAAPATGACGSGCGSGCGV